MFATSLWLIWVFSLQTGTDALIDLMVSFLVLALLIWILNKLSSKNIKILLILIGLIFTTMQLNSIKNLEIKSVNNENQENTKMSWYLGIEEDFKKSNQAYLINFTAAWCITCQANDKIALSRSSVVNYMNINNINYVVADWTNRDKDILEVLNI